MQRNNTYFRYFSLLIFVFPTLNLLFAQTDNICLDRDCPPEIFTIQLNATAEPIDGQYTKLRTEKFKNAYNEFQRISSTYNQNPEWKKKYSSFQLSGKSCLRHYRLESAFANEYLSNSDFKTFVDARYLNNELIKEGFNSSRRGLNLARRMKSNCPREIGKADEGLTSGQKDMPLEYNRLGIALGYFDKNGQVLKALPEIEENKTANGKKARIEALKANLANLPIGGAMVKRINDMTNTSSSTPPEVSTLKSSFSDLNSLFDALLPKTSSLSMQLASLDYRLNNLSNSKGKEPSTGLLSKLKNLRDRKDILMQKVEAAADKSTQLKTTFDKLTKDTDNVKNGMSRDAGELENLKENLTELNKKKVFLDLSLDGQPKKILDELTNKVNELSKQATDFATKVAKAEQGRNGFSTDMADLMQREANIATELENLVGITDVLTKEEAKLVEDINDAEDEITAENLKAKRKSEEDEIRRQKAEQEAAQERKMKDKLKAEEDALKAEYGRDLKLEPVTIKEWSQSFEVERPYWNAVFHPDDEVVEGYKGKYFQIRLKDAEKNVKLLFGPGKYFMEKNDFRDNYGSTIGAFVVESLNAMKKADKSKVILFIQGSADIVGQNTFKGKLDESFLYEEVSVLPMKNGTDNFAGAPITKNIPVRNFTNKDLPNLRGNFLKEMISVYSKKLEPVLLEGLVKKEADKGERNAVIYLFIPDELLED